MERGPPSEEVELINNIISIDEDHQNQFVEIIQIYDHGEEHFCINYDAKFRHEDVV